MARALRGCRSLNETLRLQSFSFDQPFHNYDLSAFLKVRRPPPMARGFATLMAPEATLR